MKKSDTRSVDARALEVSQLVNNALNSDKGILEAKREARLMRVVIALLEFKSIRDAALWLMEKNPMCGNLPPIDLVGSEYAVIRNLLPLINELRGRAMSLKKDDRIMHIETGKKGTVSHRFRDAQVSLIFDDGAPAELPASSLKKIPKNS